MTFAALSPLSMALACLVLFLIAVAFFVHLKSKVERKNINEKDSFLRSLPGPFGVPFLGSSYIMMAFNKPWDAFSALHRRYGEIYGLTLGSRRCVVVSSMTLIKEVLVTKSQDFANRPDFLRFHAIFRGDRNLSIALCDWSDKQKTRRELAFPFMHPRAFSLDGSRMNGFITSELQELVKSLARHHDKVIEPRPFLLVATANIFYQYLCSKRFFEDDENFKQTVEIYDKVFRQLFQGFAIDFMPWLRIISGRQLRNIKELAKKVSNITSQIFDEHKQVIDTDGPKDLVDIFLTHLEQNKSVVGGLTEEDAEVIIEDLIGGHSVLGNLWLWGLYFMAANPDVRKNIRDEVLSVTSNCRAPTMEDRISMPYTEATTLELLRVITSPIIPHVATKDTSIQDYRIPKDSMVMFNIYDINMDPELWDEPRRFKPERFLTQQGKIFKPDFFIPFGTGRRTCLGDGLVKSTLFLGLSTLLQVFDIVLPAGLPEPDIFDVPGLVVPKNEISLVFRLLGDEITTDSTFVSVS